MSDFITFQCEDDIFTIRRSDVVCAQVWKSDGKSYSVTVWFRGSERPLKFEFDEKESAEGVLRALTAHKTGAPV